MTKKNAKPDAINPDFMESVVEEARPAAARGRFHVDELNVRELVRKIMRRKWVVIATAVSVTTVTAIILFQLTPRYSAEALVRIEPQEANFLDLKGVISGLGSDDEAIESELQVFQSRRLAKRVIETLHLDQNPEFNDALRQKGFVETYLDPRKWLSNLLPQSAADPTLNAADAAADQKAQEMGLMVDEFLRKLDISVKGRSRVIGVVATSESPKLAAEIANTLSHLYIDNQLNVNIEATKRASTGLNQQIATLRKSVDDSEKAVEDYRKAAGLIATDDGATLQTRQLSELNTRLALARADREAKVAKLSQVRQLINEGKVDSLPEVLQSPLIQSLREQESQVQRKIAELSSEYGNLHPKMINARAEAADLETKIQSEINKIVTGMQNDVDVAKANEQALQRSVNELENKVAEANTTAIKLRALEREAAANKTLLETFLSRVKETSAQENADIQQPEARIISLADIPTRPSFPKKTLILTLTFAASLFAGLALVFAIEQFTNGFRSGEEIEAEFGLPVLGLVPLLKSTTSLNSWQGLASRIAHFMTGGMVKRPGPGSKASDSEMSQDDPTEYILNKPASAFGEAIRGVQTSLLLRHGNNLPLRILITSAQPNEGKTVLTVCLARTLATSGYRVVLVEADLRLPAVRRQTDGARELGLTEFLSGEASLEDVMQTDSESGAHVITAGRISEKPLDLLASDEMRDLLDDLAIEHDFVIIDSPPIMAVSDARVISVMADYTLFAVRWTSTSRNVVALALNQLKAAGAEIAGTVLTMVNAKEHAKYNYGDSGYYYSAVQKYYVK